METDKKNPRRKEDGKLDFRANNLMGYLFYRRISVYFTKFFIYLKISPNQISLLSLLLKISGALLYYFSVGYYKVFSVLLFQLGALLDHVDGDVAFYANKKSERGAFLDPVFDRLGDIIIYLAISANIFIQTNDSLAFIAAYCAIAVTFLVDTMILKFKNIKPKAESFSKKMTSNNESILKRLLAFGFTFYCGEFLLTLLCIGIIIEKEILFMFIIAGTALIYGFVRFLMFYRVLEKVKKVKQ